MNNTENALDHCSFILKLCKANADEVETLLKNASKGELTALQYCLLAAKDVKKCPLKPCVKNYIRKEIKIKKLPIFFKKYKKHIAPILVCVISKLVSEMVYYYCSDLTK